MYNSEKCNIVPRRLLTVTLEKFSSFFILSLTFISNWCILSPSTARRVTQGASASDLLRKIPYLHIITVITYNTHKSAAEIAELLNAAGYTYRGYKPKVWQGRTVSRIYFGRSFLTVGWGEVSARKNGPYSPLAIGEEAVDAAARVIEESICGKEEDTGCPAPYEKDFISYSELGDDDIEYINSRY